MDRTSEAITFIVGIVIAVLLGTFALLMYNNQRETGNRVLQETDKINSALTESGYLEYDGMTVKGSRVISAISLYSDDAIYINVDGVSYNYDGSAGSLGNPKDAATKSADLKAAKTKGSATYINPNSNYTGTVDRDQTEAIVGITFVK
ncbi:MAG: hypothetical protein K2K56_13280 [Lachnospiraceae bacterium]|nr:hypothetical protein [Lachnospiraceae bacterium]